MQNVALFQAMAGSLAGCAGICENSFAGPLNAIKEGRAGPCSYCLDKLPACFVPTDTGGTRACESDAERNDPKTWNCIRQQCRLTTNQEGGRCEEIEERILNPDEWSLVLNQEGCAGRILVKLRDPHLPVRSHYRVSS